MEYREATWSVARVKSREERAVDSALCSAGLETYLPLVSRHRTYAKRRVVAQEAAYPSYLFVAWRSPEELWHVLDTPRVFGLLRVVDQAGLIQRMEELKEELAADPWQTVTDRIIPGAMVEISCGALRGMLGRVAKVKGRRVRLTGLRGIFGDIEVERGQLEVVR